jgi:hypothetical protein
LCGTAIVDAGDARAGISLYIFSGEFQEGDNEPKPSKEGTAQWIAYDALGEIPVVEDLPILLSKIHYMKRGDSPFSARSYYDDQERLTVEFAE